MKVEIISEFGNHKAGEVLDSVKQVRRDGKAVRADIDQDRDAFKSWVKAGLAVELNVDGTHKKRVGRPPKDKARVTPKVK